MSSLISITSGCIQFAFDLFKEEIPTEEFSSANMSMAVSDESNLVFNRTHVTLKTGTNHSIELKNNANVENVYAGKTVNITDSVANHVFTKGDAQVKNSKIKHLEFYQDSTISDSEVESITVHPNPNWNGREITLLTGRTIKPSRSERDVVVTLKGSTVGNITFKRSGQVCSDENSYITGTISYKS